ncbi:UNVERIFIED_CONTAM: hypothetical protein FKN15_071309 [Acipenser sinensis]
MLKAEETAADSVMAVVAVRSCRLSCSTSQYPKASLSLLLSLALVGYGLKGRKIRLAKGT